MHGNWLSGPGFLSPEDAMQILPKPILPCFDVLIKLEAEKNILAGELPFGERSFVFMLEAPCNEEADSLSPPCYGHALHRITSMVNWRASV